jgi:hypothetical protein
MYHIGESHSVFWHDQLNIKCGFDGRFIPTGEGPPSICGFKLGHSSISFFLIFTKDVKEMFM